MALLFERAASPTGHDAARPGHGILAARQELGAAFTSGVAVGLHFGEGQGRRGSRFERHRSLESLDRVISSTPTAQDSRSTHEHK